MATFGHTPLTVATTVEGSQPAGNLPAAALSARKPRNAVTFLSSGRFFRSRPLQQRGGGVIVAPAVAWSADGERRRTKLKAQEQEQVPPGASSFPYEDEWALNNYTDIFRTRPRTTYRDVLSMTKRHPPLSEKPKSMSIEERMNLHQSGRNFMSGLIEYVSSDKEYYKFLILACKENINKLMKEGLVRSYDQEVVLKGLERIEDGIAKGRLKWSENKDQHSYIVEALVDIVGEPAGKLNAAMSQDVQMLQILQLWCCNFANNIISQITQLQVELVLLALRNWGFILQTRLLRRDWILLGDIILSKVELLERDISRLCSCKKNMIDSMQLINFPYGVSFESSWISDDESHRIQNAIINFGNTIIGDIAIDLSTLGGDLTSWMSLKFLTPNDQVTAYVSALRKHVSDLDSLIKVQRHSHMMGNSIQDQDASQRFLAICVVLQQILEVATDLSKYTFFNNEKAQNFPEFGTAKLKAQDQSCQSNIEEESVLENKDGEDDAAVARQVFIDRSDETMKKLIDWLEKHQTGERPLKFCTIDLC
ncbi:hypothetical protein ACP4OV_012097 [Aristida adscensionis]